MEQLKIGILGGGQLGRMMAIAAHNLGEIAVIPLDPGGSKSPAGQICGGNGSSDGTRSLLKVHSKIQRLFESLRLCAMF